MKYIFYAIWCLWDLRVMRRKPYEHVPIEGFKPENKTVQMPGYISFSMFIPGTVTKYRKWVPRYPMAKTTVTSYNEAGKPNGWKWEQQAPKEPQWYLNFVRKQLKDGK